MKRVTFGALGRLTENDEGGADILVDGIAFGYITRVVKWDKQGSSRQNTPTIIGYEMTAWDPEGAVLSHLNERHFPNLKALKDEIRQTINPTQPHRYSKA